MLQRIQTIYLLLGAGFLSGAAFSPLARLSTPVSESPIFSDGVFSATDQSGLLILLLLVAFLLLVAVFLFRNRRAQTLLTKVGLAATLLVVAAIAYMLNASRNQLPELAALRPATGALLPVAGLVAQVLALRNIQKDDKLVRSMDRLR